MSIYNPAEYRLHAQGHRCTHAKNLNHFFKIPGRVARSLVVSDWDPKGQWFKPPVWPWCHGKIRTAVGPLSKALNPAMFRGGGVVPCQV